MHHILDYSLWLHLLKDPSLLSLCEPGPGSVVTTEKEVDEFSFIPAINPAYELRDNQTS